VTTVIICGASRAAVRRRVLPCPVCKRRRRHVIYYDWSPYYAPRIQCVACGDQWEDGELLARPFRRGWRKEAIAKAKHAWHNAGIGPVRRDEHFYVIPDEVMT